MKKLDLFYYTFENGKHDSSMTTQAYNAFFHANASLRPSCLVCTYRKKERCADITMGDFWGIEKEFPAIDDDSGISAALCCTNKGVTAFLNVASATVFTMAPTEAVVRHNKAVVDNHKPNKRRALFFSRIANDDFDELIECLLALPWWYRVLRWVKWHIVIRPKEA